MAHPRIELIRVGALQYTGIHFRKILTGHVAQNWNTIYQSLLGMYKKLAELGLDGLLETK
jgi:hypothetical protein